MLYLSVRVSYIGQYARLYVCCHSCAIPHISHACSHDTCLYTCIISLCGCFHINKFSSQISKLGIFCLNFFVCAFRIACIFTVYLLLQISLGRMRQSAILRHLCKRPPIANLRFVLCTCMSSVTSDLSVEQHDPAICYCCS